MLNQYEDNLQNERTEKARLSEDYENRVQMLTSVRKLMKVTRVCYLRWNNALNFRHFLNISFVYFTATSRSQ